MKVRIMSRFLWVFMCFGTLQLAATAQTQVLIEQPNNLGMIKILLFKNAEAANLEVCGGYRVYDSKSQIKIGKGTKDKQYLLRPTLDGIAWGELYPGVFQTVVVPEEGGYFLVNGIQYAGNLYVYQVGNSIHLVNELSIEDYVRSMLNPKVNDQMHPEVLSALAIIERTQAYYQSIKSSNAFYHLEADKINYQGKGVCYRGNGVDQAVDFTKSLVMKANSYGIQNGFFSATYTEHCAGKTAPYHLIFRQEGHAYRKPVESSFALNDRSETQWKAKISREMLSDKLGLETITNFEVYQDEASGKVYGMKFYCDSEELDVDFSKLQEIVGFENLKSSDFEVKQREGTLFFDGFGRGTGVGACLFSMQEMADRGKNADEVLNHFFPGTRITFMDIRKPF